MISQFNFTISPLPLAFSSKEKSNFIKHSAALEVILELEKLNTYSPN